MRWLDSITNLMDMNLSQFQETVKDRGAGQLQPMGLQRVGHSLATEQPPPPHFCILELFCFPSAKANDLPGVRATSLQSCPSLCDPGDHSRQAPLSLGFSRQEHWSGLSSLLTADIFPLLLVSLLDVWL